MNGWNSPIVVTDNAIRRFDPEDLGNGFFGSYPASSTQLALQRDGAYDITTVEMLFPSNFCEPNKGTFDSGIVKLAEITDRWLESSNCDHLGVGHDIGDRTTLSCGALLKNPAKWAYCARHVHYLAHLCVWPAVWEAYQSGQPVSEETMDNVTQTPENPYSSDKWRFFWGVDVGPNIGLFGLKVALIANISAAILQGDERGHAITLDQWRMLMQEPKVSINAFAKPWFYFLGLPEHESPVTSVVADILG